MHSTTKYCGGHSDVVGGAVVAARTVTVPGFEDLADRIAFHQNSMGAVAGPFDSWLVLRGLKTLGGPHGPALRQRREGRRVPRRATPRSRTCTTPGWPEHPGHEVAARQMRRYGGMVSFQVRGGEEQAVAVCGCHAVWTLGESLGGVESLIEHPGRMTHASVAGTDAGGARGPDPALGRHRGRPGPASTTWTRRSRATVIDRPPPAVGGAAAVGFGLWLHR